VTDGKTDPIKTDRCPATPSGLPNRADENEHVATEAPTPKTLGSQVTEHRVSLPVMPGGNFMQLNYSTHPR
jgi:hypothetical protein